MHHNKTLSTRNMTYDMVKKKKKAKTRLVKKGQNKYNLSIFKKLQINQKQVYRFFDRRKGIQQIRP